MDAARLAMEDEQRRQAAFDNAFETSTGGSGDYVAVYGGTGAAPEPSAGGFAAARGRLLFPVAGRAEVRPAHREGTDGPGLEIHAPVGTVVRAVFAGRVAFADRYGPYGRIVILDHGDHYYSVSGDLDEVDVKIGQEVGAGRAHRHRRRRRPGGDALLRNPARFADHRAFPVAGALTGRAD